MITAIVFSKDRACQLDLFLRSVTCNAESLFESIMVIWKGSSWEYERGYHTCMGDHQHVRWEHEGDFQVQTLELLDECADHVSFFTDDSVFYRPLSGCTMPDEALSKIPEMLCFSLRLGLHTGTCYPLQRLQALPEFVEYDDFLVWDWRTGDADFGYMGSLDGHVFRKYDMMDMIDGTRRFPNPNHLEDLLVAETNDLHLPLAGCHFQSHLVGVPVNRVNDTHPNRFGDYHPLNQSELNSSYLEGGRLDLDSVKPHRVTAAHAEMRLEFE